MFTGLIEEVGHIVETSRRRHLMDFTIEAKIVLDDMKIGDSITVNGACLTVTAVGDAVFIVQAVAETLDRTTLGKIKRGAPVNLERALRLGERLAGHLVQGHIDGTGKITSVRKIGDNMLLTIAPESDIKRYIVEKGSIAVDGVSLTVTTVRDGAFSVSIIPHTLGVTTLGDSHTGDVVNLETDILAKYVEKLISYKDGLSIEKLDALGF